MRKAIILIAMLLVLSHLGSAATITVCSSGCDFSSIQQAVNAAQNGDIIALSNETYFESTLINKSIELTGVYNKTLILSHDSEAAIRVDASHVKIKNLKIAYSLNGIHAEFVDNLTVRDSIFYKNVVCIKLYSGKNSAIVSNIFKNSEIGIAAEEYKTSFFSKNIFNNLTKGIMLQNSENNTMQNNTLINNNISAELSEAHNNNFKENIVLHSDGVGIACSGSTGNIISDNLVQDIPLFLSFSDCSQNSISDNYVNESSKYARDTLSLGNNYAMNGLNFIGSQLEFNLVDIIAPAGFHLLSDVLNVSFIYDLSRKTTLEFNSKYYAGSLAGLDTSTVGLYTYQDSKISGLTKANYDGENATLYSEVTDAADIANFVNDYGIDADSDGLNEYLAVSVNALVSIRGRYRFTASLYDNEGTFIAYGYSESDLTAGLKTVEVLFSGSDIKGVKNGSFTIHHARAAVNTTNFIMQQPSLYRTSAYNTNLFEEPLQSYAIPMILGWNLISIPFQVSTTPSQLFSGLNYDSVWAYVNGAWLSYSPSKPAFLNTLQTVNETLGLWLKMNAAGALFTDGILASQTDIPLHTGWNLAGYPSLTNQTVADALLSIDGNYTSVFMFRNNVWHSFDPSRPAFLNTLSTIAPGGGYWIRMNDSDTWHII